MPLFLFNIVLPVFSLLTNFFQHHFIMLFHVMRHTALKDCLSLPSPQELGRLLTGAHGHIHGKRQCESYVPYSITRHREHELFELRGIPGLSKSADSWKNISATSPGEVGFRGGRGVPPTPKLKYYTKDLKKYLLYSLWLYSNQLPISNFIETPGLFYWNPWVIL